MEEHAIALGDPGYPARLRELADPPEVLFARGSLAPAIAGGHDLPPAIAIVGARDATAYGIATARDLARRLAEHGVLVVSGLAVGIDGAAHRGALEGDGLTIAVVGSGTDVVYPRSHARLRDQILSSGAVIGELPEGMPPLPHQFPRRNRLISGLALGVVVVEATQRSGSLVTAKLALEQGREIFAVPGPVSSPRSRGPHALLKQGAKLVESVEDILRELPLGVAGRLGPTAGGGLENLSPRCVAVLEAIAAGAATADEIALREVHQVSEIYENLLQLEVRGAIVRGAGGRYALRAGMCGVAALPADPQDRPRVDCPDRGS